MNNEAVKSIRKYIKENCEAEALYRNEVMTAAGKLTANIDAMELLNNASNVEVTVCVDAGFELNLDNCPIVDIIKKGLSEHIKESVKGFADVQPVRPDVLTAYPISKNDPEIIAAVKEALCNGISKAWTFPSGAVNNSPNVTGAIDGSVLDVIAAIEKGRRTHPQTSTTIIHGK